MTLCPKDEVPLEVAIEQNAPQVSSASKATEALLRSMALRQQTGLPVDFQIQRQTQANEEYSRKTGHGREPLGFFLRANPADQ
jgi:hypothetical protein